MKRLLTAGLALSLLTGTAAMAQPDHRDAYDHRNDNGGYSQRNDNGGYSQRNDNRDNDHRDNGDRRDDHGMDRGRGYGHDNGHHWARGQRLPVEYYRDRGHYVDYRSHHLRAPPRGYRWVEAGNNYALVAITSGLIASIIAHQ